MKVLYDFPAFEQKYGGVSNCFVELIANLPSEWKWELGVIETTNYHLLEKGILPNVRKPRLSYDNFIRKENFKGKYQLYQFLSNHIPFFLSSTRRNKQLSIQLLKKGDFDIFHSTYFDDYFLPYLNGKPFAITIHDMVPEIYCPNNHIYAKDICKKKKLAEKADLIIAVSENTKKDILRFYPNLNPSKIKVVYHGYPVKSCLSQVKNNTFSKPYFLFVGKRNGYKNFQYTLQEFAAFIKQGYDYQLVCTGAGFNQEEKKLIYNLQLTERVVQKFVSEEELMCLYRNATAFVYPSSYEGFGIPILEAYSESCPVLLSKLSCFPEIGGDAAFYFDLKANDLCNLFIRVSELSKQEKLIIINKMAQRLSMFSWKNSALQLSEYYKEIIYR